MAQTFLTLSNLSNTKQQTETITNKLVILMELVSELVENKIKAKRRVNVLVAFI